jgi:hypothetical protein
LGTFLNDLAFGRVGEEVVISSLAWMLKELHIADAKEYDIRDEETWMKIEVKTDRWALKTGNICLELWSHVYRQSEGWLQYSTADALAYVMCDTCHTPREIDVYDFPRLKSHVFYDVLHEDWWSTAVGLGRIVNARHHGNTHVRNLLLPREHLGGFLMDQIVLDGQKERVE